MDELSKGQAVGLIGAVRDEAMAAFTRQIDQWELAMPPAEAIVWDFGLGDFYDNGIIECWIANEVAAGYCGKFLFVFDGQTCPMHYHRQKVETFFVVKGTLRMDLADETREMSPGDVLLMDVNQDHSFTGIGPALLLEVSRPCIVDDNYFRNTKIPVGGNYDPS